MTEEPYYRLLPNRRLAPCPVDYCRAEAGHRTPHDIAPCLKTCGPLRPGKGREHDPACRNHNFYGEVSV